MKRVRLNSKSRKAFQGSSRGFSLIEVLIALALMGLIAIAVLGALSTASAALITADKRATAESLARSQMEYVKNQGYNSTQPGGIATYKKITGIPDGYTIWSVNRNGQIVNGGANDGVIGIPWDSTSNNATNNDVGLQKITVIVSRDGKAIITLEGYKRNPNA